MPPKKSKKDKESPLDDDEVMSDSEQKSKVKGRGRGRPKKLKKESPLVDDDDDDEVMSDSEQKSKVKGRGRGRPKKLKKESPLVDDDDDEVMSDSEQKSEGKGRGRKRKVEEKEKEEEEEKKQPSKKQKVDVDEYIKEKFSNAKSSSDLNKIEKELRKKYSDKRDILQIISKLLKLKEDELKEEKKQKEAGAYDDIMKGKQNLYEWFKKFNNYELNGINKISYKAINNYVISDLGNLYEKFKLFDILYTYISRKYPSISEKNILIDMCLMLDSVHDFIGERTELTSEDKEIMIKTIFQIDTNNLNDLYMYGSLEKLKAGDFENELLLWLLCIKYNNYDVVSKALFGDMISIGEQSKKDNLSSLFTIDAFNKSFEVYRNTLYYMATEIDTNKDKVKLISEIDKNVDKFLFRINIIDKLNNITTILKKEDNYSPKNVKPTTTYLYVIHLLRNYILNYKFDELNLIDEENDIDKMTNMNTFFDNYNNNFSVRNETYFIDIDNLKSSLKKILNLPDINKEKDLENILTAWLNKIQNMNNYPKDLNILNLYDKEIPKYQSIRETSESLIDDRISKANNKLISDVISKSKEYIQFVAIPPQLFDANESTGGENMRILNIKSKIDILEQKDKLSFKLLQDTCSLEYDKKDNKNYIFTVDNIKYPINTIIIKDSFNASGYSTWDISSEKYAYKKDKKRLECRSCPGVTELFELYKIFTERKYNFNEEDVLNNIFQIKRAGDYSQIFFCKLYNNNNDKTIYFLSNDRMSSSFCLLLDVPFVAPIYSGAMGSDTFGVYYNPYKDRKKLYLENKTKEDNNDIINSLIPKFVNIKKLCNQISYYDKEFKCNIEDIDNQIDILKNLKNSKNEYEIVSKLLVSQEIYKEQKYIINQKFDSLYASQILQTMRTQTDIIQIPDKLFINSQDKVTYKLHYKYLTKLYKYIKSLYILDPNSLELKKNIILYNYIYNAINNFLENGYDGDIGLNELFSAVKDELEVLEEDETLFDEVEYTQQESQNLFDSNSSTNIKYVYNPLTKDISLKKYKHYNSIMFYNEKGYLLVQDFNPSAVIKIKSIQKAKEQTYPDGTKITFKLN
jgi:hypothetical protein